MTDYDLSNSHDYKVFPIEGNNRDVIVYLKPH